jgi:hypothetical protein
MPEARLHRDEVVRQRHQREGPGKQDCSRNSLLEREGEAEQAGQIEEEVICFANGFVEEAVFGRFGNADPEEEKAFQGVFDEAEFMRANLLFGEFAFAMNVRVFAHLTVVLEDRAYITDGDRRSPWKALVFFEDGLMEFRAEVPTHRDEGVEDGVVANRPWGDACESEDAGERAAKKCRKDGALSLEGAGQHPQAACRQE